jgi:type I restriction enzyme S subunit
MSSEVPDEWRVAKLVEVAALSGGTTPSKTNDAYWLEGTVPWATPTDITSLPPGKTRIAATERYVAEVALAECSLKLNPPNTVLMTSRATIGYAAINDVPMATNQGFLNFNCSENCDPEFLCHWLNSSRSLLTAAAGGSTFKELSRSTAKLLPILVPPLHEQRRIAEVLRSVGQVIQCVEQNVRQSLRLWETLVEARIWLPAFEDSMLAPLSKSIRASDYGVNAPLTDEAVGTAVLRMGNLQGGQIDLTNLKWGVISDEEAKPLRLRDGDILFNRTNSRDLVGKVAIVRGEPDYLYASYLVRLSIDQSVSDPYFVFAAMNSRRGQAALKTIATPGVSQSNINPTNLKKLPFPLFSLAAQRTVAEELRAVENARLASIAELSTLQATFSHLSSQLLSGRIRVPA